MQNTAKTAQETYPILNYMLFFSVNLFFLFQNPLRQKNLKFLQWGKAKLANKQIENNNTSKS